MIFHPNIRNLFIGRGILAGLTSTVGVTVFSGTQPPISQVEANWSTYSSQILVHWSGVGFTQPLDGILLSVTAFPTPAVATATGTAKWAIIWSTNLLSADVAGSTLPSTSFIVVPVSIASGTGVIRVADVNITSGSSITLQDASIGASST